MKTNFSPGDKVAYSVQFLRSIGEGPTSPLCHARGEITEIKSYGKNFQIAKISWVNNPDNLLPDGVNCVNLAKVPGSKTIRADGTAGIVAPNDKFCAC